mmetsp:Transcript_18442/g.34805  ORF Transcript_18442/g.34805 Transcript_18442/m.34805 type:complete len:136 (-) Transcript_18442:299-706(-)
MIKCCIATDITHASVHFSLENARKKHDEMHSENCRKTTMLGVIVEPKQITMLLRMRMTQMMIMTYHGWRTLGRLLVPGGGQNKTATSLEVRGARFDDKQVIDDQFVHAIVIAPRDAHMLCIYACVRSALAHVPAA